jgi:hypothetical protein
MTELSVDAVFSVCPGGLQVMVDLEIFSLG